MAEYIEREALRSKAVYMHGFGKIKYVPLRAIEEAQSAEVAHVVHGQWQRVYEDSFGWVDRCSHCKSISEDVGKYCSNCGARMDGAVNG